MHKLEQEFLTLTQQYFNIIGPHHHKDRDCHWYITKVWSYGNAPTYRVEHNGYLYSGLDWEACGKDIYFQSYKDALTFAITKIKEAIKDTEGWETEC